MLRFDPSELRKFGGLTLQARGVVEGFLTGIHRSPFKGYAVEFAEHRPYTPGDEIRRIDWRAYCKTDRYYVRESEEDTNLAVQLLVDASGSMAYGAKWDHARLAAAALAYLMLHQGDAVGLSVQDTAVRARLPAKASPKHLIRILQTLENITPGGDTQLAGTWRDLALHEWKRRSLIIIVSDFWDDLDAMIRALQLLRHRRHEVVLVQVLTPDELEFPFRGRTTFQDVERPADRRTLAGREVRKEYLARMTEFRETLRKRAGDMQIDWWPLRTDEPLDRVLAGYLGRRRRIR